MAEYFRNSCPARGPGLPHTMHGAPGSPCRECGLPLTTEPPNERLPLSASEARRTLGTSHVGAEVYNRDFNTREAGVPPEHDDDTPVEPRAITGQGPQGRLSGRGRGPFTKRDADRAAAHVEYRRWLGQHGGGEEQ